MSDKKEYMRKWSSIPENREKIRKYNLSEECKERRRRWYLLNRERLREYARLKYEQQKYSTKCSCGRYITNKCFERHINSNVHVTGLVKHLIKENKLGDIIQENNNLKKEVDTLKVKLAVAESKTFTKTLRKRDSDIIKEINNFKKDVHSLKVKLDVVERNNSKKTLRKHDSVPLISEPVEISHIVKFF